MAPKVKLIHDLLNELQAVNGFIELAIDHEDDKQIQEYLKKAHGEMRQIFNNVRKLRKIIEGETR